VNAETVSALRSLHGADRVAALEWNYHRFNHARFRSTDPVSFVWKYSTSEDREIAAWAASALAYGRVGVILRTLADLDRRWESQPAAFLRDASKREQQQALKGFVYRWTREQQLLGHLRGYHQIQREQRIPLLLKQHSRNAPGGLRDATAVLAQRIRASGENDPGHLLPDPSGNSACKRLAMWLRWMVRKDAIDPGPWSELLSPAQLWVPLDTHMFRIARQLQLTRRRAPDAEAARRITATFARSIPEDPVRYDFAITRMGMGVSDEENG
jgi:uncharacterized protein (TIGR02757 family)